MSPKYGEVTTLLDDNDFDLVSNRGGSWSVSLMRNNKFYFEKRENGKLIKLHRLVTNAPKGLVVDHISGNTLDNRQSNLRVCSNAANIRNGKLRTTNSTGVQGVIWDKSRDKWQSRIKVNYKTVHLGRYDSLEEATKARKLAERKYWSV